MIKGKRLGYIRVSTADQNPDRQLEGIELDKKFTDFASGKSLERPQLKVLMEFAREDDIIFVHSMDRLGRKVKDIRELLDFFLGKGIQVEFLKENLKFTGKDDPVSNCVLNIFASVAEFEYSLLKERQMEGIELAKKAGKYKRLGLLKVKREGMEIIRQELKGRKPKAQIAREHNISRFTLYKYIQQFNLMETSA